MTTSTEGVATSVDRELIRGAQRGDPLAISDLMELLLPYVGRICGPIALQDGPDATQEAMIAVMRGIRALDGRRAMRRFANHPALRDG